MAFSEVEMSIFAQLGYKDVDYKTASEESLHELLVTNRDSLCDSLGPSYEQYIDALIDKVEGQDYKIVASEHDKDSGFAAFAFSTPDNEVVVSCRGTQMDKANDILTDAGLGLVTETQQHRDMEAFVDRLERQGYDGYYFTGHSLGGNVATHGAVTIGDAKKVRGVYAYNSPGFNEGYWAANGKKLEAIEYCINNFQNEYDYVSSILRVPGKKYIIASSVTGGHMGFDDHSINAFTIDENGRFVPNGTGRKNPHHGAVGDRIGEFGQNLGFNNTLPILRIYNAYTEWKSRETRRDFSDEAREMLIGAAQETEDEKWWQVTKWDCWYKVDQYFGVLEWDLYTGNVDSYYRKLIDINDASVKDIERIFEKVYELDSSYSGKISDASDNLRAKVLTELQRLSASIVVG